MKGNAIVGQSGGPTSVINASLAGVFQACQMRGAEHVYGMLHGIQGLLDRKVCDLSERLSSFLDIELLKRTPSSFLGSCRYKLPAPEEDEAVYEKLFGILKDLNIQWFFYIGGNDSMDTICKLSQYGARIGSPIRFMGVPKTIDNDLMLTDHTPGYGSAAKYIGVVMKEIIRDATVYGTNFVTIVEIMGRNAGWLTAAAALARGEDCEGVDLICLPELPFHTDRFLAKVERMQKERASIVIAVSEGVKLPDGRFVCELSDDHRTVDAFGHINLNGTARYLSNLVAKNLPTRTRPVELSILQRCGAHLSSRTDITEAFQVGGAAAKAAFEGETGKMVALYRISNDPYQCTTKLVDIKDVANLEKKVPTTWINDAKTDMLPEFLAYARPLIQAELTPIYINGLTQHIVEG
ncbi:MAG: 6-phosphofructokinase [Clostridia bacterium]|nr:6-phosphofructokinase [Clostridia bacterium]